ncbi:PDC sensor domain-containing protein, partial [Campylobacter sp. RM12327]|uniref:cache domain-containing protein n=3 Tax=Campylobacter sputorum TaxID=206 RepID=UPI0018968580
MFRKVASKISLIILVLLFMSFAIFSTVNYSSTKNTVLDLSEQSNSKNVLIVDVFVEEFFEQRVQNLDKFANYLNQNTDIISDEEKIKKQIYIASLTAGVNGFYFGFTNREMITSRTSKDGITKLSKRGPSIDQYDATSRGWYKDAVKNGKLTFSPPYISSGTGDVTVTFSKPVYKGETLLGVLAVDIFLNKLNYRIDSMIDKSDNSTDMITILDLNSKYIISHPNKDIVLSDKPEAKNIVSLFEQSYAKFGN